MKRRSFTALSLAALLLFGLSFLPRPASAYLMGPPPTLAQTDAQSDVVVKARAISSRPAQDLWLGTTPGTTVEETRFQVISSLKGAEASSVIAFRHYRPDPSSGEFFINVAPIRLDFTPGRTYLLCAKSTGGAHAYRQLWKMPPGYNSTSGVFLCADAQPIGGSDLSAAVWHELTGLLQSRSASDQTYALGQMDTLSGGSLCMDGPTEYSRPRVLTAAAPLLAGSDADVTKTALALIAGHSQYLTEESGTHWTPRRYRQAETPDAAANAYAAQIFRLADTGTNADVRALAIRALAVSGTDRPGLEAAAVRWAADPAPAVRSATALLLAAAPGPDAQGALDGLSRDAAPTVRASVARGIERAQNASALPLLTTLLRDPALPVREAAASALTAFPVAQTGKILRANLADPEFKSIFVVTLAEENPAPYRAALIEIIQKRLVPPEFSGNLPDATAWDILFAQAGSQSRTVLASGAWDAALHALETAQFGSSSEPRDLYAFYISHGLTGRAHQFRLACKKTIPFDMEPYFSAVDRQAAPAH